MVAVLAFIPRLEPRKQNLLASAGPYHTLWIALIAFLGVMHLVLVLATIGIGVNVALVALTAVGLLFMVIGSQLGQTRSNHFMGIRTPWTLSSELAWEKTHLLGGKLFFALGALFIVSGLIGNEVLAIVILVAAVPATVIALLIYSYRVWQQDPSHGRP
jgi:uncharacterized membrane protein